MRKLLLVLIGNLMSFGLFAQSFVDTTQQNRNVILEEFTGKGCIWCPDGHRTSNNLAERFPGRVIPINIHTGGYAAGTPNYRAEIDGKDLGASLSTNAGVSSFPSATINRAVFRSVPASKTPPSREDWARFSELILAEPSYVNIAAKSTIDWSTRLLTITVEAYYTGEPKVATNTINAALLLNGTMGSQNGDTVLYPEMIVNNQYMHNHMLRNLFPSVDGDTIRDIVKGSLITKVYTYTIPTTLNGIEEKLENMEVVVYVSEPGKEIITGAKSSMEHLNVSGLPSNQILFTDLSYKSEIVNGQREIHSSIHFRNQGANPITSLTASYSLDGINSTEKTWTFDPLNSFESKELEIPTSLVDLSTTRISITITAVNGTALTTPLKKDFSRTMFAGFGFYAIQGPLVGCDSTVSLQVIVQNFGLDDVAKISYTYGPENNTKTAVWEGRSNNRALDTIHLQNIIIPIFSGVSERIIFQADSVNDIAVKIDPQTVSMKKNLIWAKESIKIKLYQDKYGSDITWKLTDQDNNNVLEGGPYADLENNGTLKQEYEYLRTKSGCYTLTIEDKMGDGINNGFGIGKIQIVDSRSSSDSVRLSTNGKHGFGTSIPIMLQTEGEGITSIQETVEEMHIFPNPVSNTTAILSLDLKKALYATINIYETSGKQVKSLPQALYTAGNHQVKLDVMGFAKGVYLVEFLTEEGSINTKMIISK